MEITASFTDNVVYIFIQGILCVFGFTQNLLQYLRVSMSY